MARHSKNATSAPFYSYHERKKIRALGVGTLKERLDTRACRRFECCWLCLSPARMPLATPQEAAAAAEAKATEAQRAFLETEASLSLDTSAAAAPNMTPQNAEEFRETLIEPLITSKEEARAKNFWVPENTPDEPEAKIQEPQKGLCCPITGASLRIKQLVKVKPNLSSRDDTETTRWLCALSGREISHQKAAVVKSTGQVILLEYLEKLVFGKKGALTSGIIEKKDTVTLVSGGTGFSAHNKVEVSVARPNVQ
ncbi:nitric oxide synthase-interacting protein [Cyclospora cayetanensis]|uniref:Nitric oxide synthase-interacting protein n=1 Tax=Cyclospora cayetanensis TaxID=88456 RepID=A0A6P6RRK3_9EIME|nr:nitric oxide synthase-interacting protein [Cyclospora cayetanensis]